MLPTDVMQKYYALRGRAIAGSAGGSPFGAEDGLLVSREAGCFRLARGFSPWAAFALVALTVAALLPLRVAHGAPNRPSGGGMGRQMVVTVKVRGKVDLENDFYYVVFNVNGVPRNGFTGPVPVVTGFQRGGNGFAGGAFNCFVEGHRGEPQGSDFGIYRIGTDLLSRTYLSAPIEASVSGDTLSFRLPLATLASASGISEAQVATLQVNIIATNVVPTNPQDTANKYFDALGDPRTGDTDNFVTLSTRQATRYNNFSSVAPEGPGDVASYDGDGHIRVVPGQDGAAAKAPADVATLDIVDWTIEFRN